MALVRRRFRFGAGCPLRLGRDDRSSRSSSAFWDFDFFDRDWMESNIEYIDFALALWD